MITQGNLRTCGGGREVDIPPLLVLLEQHYSSYRGVRVGGKVLIPGLRGWWVGIRAWSVG